MAGIPAVLVEPKLQKLWLIIMRFDFTDRCAWTPDTCRHSMEGVPSLSVLSNSHSVIKTW